ncbi:HNH endonuclease [Sedimentitalea todarodis]|uniref:HNH endonuclease n=1 Tax=Sedimentitalea todarodis TaxID=1631240 RepID=UPI003743010E
MCFAFINCHFGSPLCHRLSEIATAPHQVVRHRCHNRRCVNPEHLVIGTRADNLRDEWDRQANGVDFNLL